MELPLACSGAHGENIQNKLGAVNYPAIEGALKVPLLSGSQLLVEKHDVSLEGRDQLRQFLYLSGADERGRLRGRSGLDEPVENLSSGRGGQSGQLGKRFFRTRSALNAGRQAPQAPAARQFQPYQYGAFLRISSQWQPLLLGEFR